MKNPWYRLLALLVPAFLLGSCSSAPKRPAEVFTIQSMIETQLGLANKEADQGNFTKALVFLDEAWRLALLSDRPAPRIRVNLSRGNVLYSLGRTAEAEQIWRDAEAEADLAGEPVLAAAGRVYMARSRLMSGRLEPGEALALVEGEQNNLKSDKLLAAMGWTVRGLAEKELGRYAGAEKSLRTALSTHEGGNYLEQAAYDWYIIASVRSVAGNYPGALEALNQSLALDRRAENSFGLAMDWAAMGDVYRKMSRKEEARDSWRRAARIFRAMDMESQAREMEKRD
ncbi:MAG: tetratricopeptide repeat protein [Treponema sp.]|nr:tetratricopeptide repeat protein [Treponema sp.]